MCNPAIALLAVTAVGGGMSAYQQYAIGKQNAAISRSAAETTKEIGRFNENRARDRMSRLIARQRGQLAARGVRLDSTSAERLGDEAGREAFTEAQAQRFNTDSRATAQSNEGILHDYRGKMGLITGLAQTGANTLTSGLKLWPDMAGT